MPVWLGLSTPVVGVKLTPTPASVDLQQFVRNEFGEPVVQTRGHWRENFP